MLDSGMDNRLRNLATLGNCRQVSFAPRTFCIKYVIVWIDNNNIFDAKSSSSKTDLSTVSQSCQIAQPNLNTSH